MLICLTVTPYFIHTVMWLSDYTRGLDLVISLTVLLKFVGTSNYSAIANSHTTAHYSNALSFLSLVRLHRLSGNGFQRRKLLSFRVQRLLSSLAGVYFTTQLGAAMKRLTKMGDPPPPTPPSGAIVCDDLRRDCLSTANCRLTTLSRLT
jgi:hypothetical protein